MDDIQARQAAGASVNEIVADNGRVIRTHILRGPECQMVVKCGLGANSWAMLILLHRQGKRPRAIITADPGYEWDESWLFMIHVGAHWLESVGFPVPTIVSRASEGKYRRREVRKVETLREECDRLEMPPSAAFGKSRCSMVYKAEPSFWWLQRQPWARLEHGMRRRIAIAIGYDADERHRWELADEFRSNKTEAEWSYPVYPLAEAGIGRDECERMCLDEFGPFVEKLYGRKPQFRFSAREDGPVPVKSACKFCPNNTIADWYRLARNHPNDYLDIVELSRRTEKNVTSEAVGFLRNAMPAGKRHLHVWHDGGYPDAPPPPVPGKGGPENFAAPTDDGRDEMPCECAL